MTITPQDMADAQMAAGITDKDQLALAARLSALQVRAATERAALDEQDAKHVRQVDRHRRVREQLVGALAATEAAIKELLAPSEA